MKYAAIVAQIEQAIADGDLDVGDRLPAERALAVQHGVSRMTVRQALGVLEARGLIRRATGRSGGSFVAPPKVERDLASFSGLSAQLARQGLVAGARVLEARTTEAGIEIVRLRLADREPLALERSTFPHRFAQLLERDLTGSLYGLLEDAAPVRAVERIEPVLADADDAELLRVHVGDPLLLVDRVAYSEDGDVVETARDLFRGDRTRIVAWTLELVRA
ncbi:MAG TPA: GntR family transcriptional regulator [Gaiellaceae bacterium]|nr:GntR family transcriptional regulator [Gaiellaceae bacterium]